MESEEMITEFIVTVGGERRRWYSLEAALMDAFVSGQSAPGWTIERRRELRSVSLGE